MSNALNRVFICFNVDKLLSIDAVDTVLALSTVLSAKYVRLEIILHDVFVTHLKGFLESNCFHWTIFVFTIQIHQYFH